MRYVALKRASWGLALLQLAVLQVFSQDAVYSLQALSESFSLTVGKISTVHFTCMMYTNETALEILNSTVTFFPRLMSHNQLLGDLFTASDCGSSTPDELASWYIAPLTIPKPTGLSLTDFVSATFPFCYRSKQAGDDIVVFNCVTSNGVISLNGKITVSSSDSMGPRAFYFGMAPFLFVFSVILLCNILIWRKVMNRRMRQQQREADRLQRVNQLVNPVYNGVSPMRSSPGGLSAEAIEAIPVNEVPELGGELTKDICVICQDEFAAGDKIKALRCNHTFHSACIDVWLRKSSHCPICISEVSLA